jgi:hypothetical protein
MKHSLHGSPLYVTYLLYGLALYIILMVGEYSGVREVFADGSLSAWDHSGTKMSLCPTKYVLVYIKSTTVYVPSSELGLSQPLSPWRVCPPARRGGGHTRLRVMGWGSPNSDDWRKSLSLCLLCALSLLYNEIFR